jgi:hypothetical protein
VAKKQTESSAPKCPVSRKEFKDGAKPVAVKIGDQSLIAMPKEFSTESFGWHAQGKIVMEVNGVAVQVQVGVNLTVVGSKEAAK